MKLTSASTHPNVYSFYIAGFYVFLDICWKPNTEINLRYITVLFENKNIVLLRKTSENIKTMINYVWVWPASLCEPIDIYCILYLWTKVSGPWNNALWDWSSSSLFKCLYRFIFFTSYHEYIKWKILKYWTIARVTSIEPNGVDAW